MVYTGELKTPSSLNCICMIAWRAKRYILFVYRYIVLVWDWRCGAPQYRQRLNVHIGILLQKCYNVYDNDVVCPQKIGVKLWKNLFWLTFYDCFDFDVCVCVLQFHFELFHKFAIYPKKVSNTIINNWDGERF